MPDGDERGYLWAQGILALFSCSQVAACNYGSLQSPGSARHLPAASSVCRAGAAALRLASARLTNVVVAVPGYLCKPSSSSCCLGTVLLTDSKGFPQPGGLAAVMVSLLIDLELLFAACLWAGEHWVFLMLPLCRCFSGLKGPS